MILKKSNLQQKSDDRFGVRVKKLIVILGQTSTGKSDIAVKIAKKFGGEIISADSRQVYFGLNFGTGKITKKEMGGITHHMLDISSPKKRFDVAQWQKETRKNISEIFSRENIPIICGGTGFYIQSIVENIVLPEVPPDKKLREKLGNKSLTELISILKKLDPEISKTIDNKNSIRLIRAIEIATHLGKVPKLRKEKNNFEILQIGLKLPDEELKKRIYTRLLSRIKKGMVREIKKLHQNGLSWKRMNELGLEYRYSALFLQKKLTRGEFVQKLFTEIWHFARRQKQWFKRDKNIHWFLSSQYLKIEKVAKNFLLD